MAQITYTNKVALNENQEVADINKVNASDMNEIKSVVNGLVSDTYSTDTEQSYSCNYLNSINDYSTSEINTGKKWINGEPIYRKVITGTWPSSNVSNWTRVPNFEGNIRLLKVYGIQEALSGYDRNDIPRYESSTNFVVFAEIQGTLCYRFAGYTNRKFRIVVEYVKP